MMNLDTMNIKQCVLAELKQGLEYSLGAELGYTLYPQVLKSLLGTLN